MGDFSTLIDYIYQKFQNLVESLSDIDSWEPFG